jgi:transcriptional regulator with XRE-family HTH domain
MTKWTADKIKRLRLRLGWSTADFSRRFGCQTEVVMNWELGLQQPTLDDARQLDRLEFYLESYSEQVARDPIAENIIKSEGLDQVHQDHVSLRLNS